MTSVSLTWYCFFGLDECLEIRVDYEGCSCVIAEIAEGGLTPLPPLGHHEQLTTALHVTTIMLMMIESVLALEVAQALLTPMNSVVPFLI